MSINTQKKQSIKGLVLEIQKLSTEDGPGIRTSIFFKGCPLKCIWCHNPESIPANPGLQWFKVKCIGCSSCVEICPEKALVFDKNRLRINRKLCTICGKCVVECPSTALKIFGKEWTVDELYHEVEKDRSYYEKSNGGITVSGGEPFLQIDFIEEFLKKCKLNKISTALDTCGYTTQKNLERIFPLVDLFLFDLKEINSNKHEDFTGVPNELILENILWLVNEIEKTHKEIWIRTPVIPNYTASQENIRGIAEFIVKKLNNKILRWDLLAFNNLARDKYERMDKNWEMKDIPLLKESEMEYFLEIALEEGVKNVQWSGMTRKEELSDN